MTLATSCPSCGTVFKVIEDQLKVSEGWVRCGHCHSVFNALEGLFDLGARPRSGHSRPMTEGLASGSGVLQETPEMAPASEGGPASDTSTRAPRSAVATSGLAAPSSFGAADTSSELPTEFVPPSSMSEAGPDEAVMVMPAPEDSVHERHELISEDGSTRRHPDFSDADTVFLAHDPQGSFDLGLLSERPGEDLPDLSAKALEPRFDAGVSTGAAGLDDRDPVTGLSPSAATAGPGEDDALHASDPALWGEMDSAPSFVRHADRAAWWGRPAVRATLLAACVLAIAGVLLQFGLMRRDLLAAQSPLAASVLSPICEVVGCTIEAPRLLDALAVENSTMVKLTGIDGYRLQVMLRNRAEHVVRAPSVELSLTDATGALVVRRVLHPADFLQAEALAASAEGNWQLEFASSDRRVAGYTVAIFYP